MQKLFGFSSLHCEISIAFRVAIFANDALRREPYPTLRIAFKLMLIDYIIEPIRNRVWVINLKASLTHSVPGDSCIWLLLHAGAPEIIGIWSCSKTRPCLCITWLTFASWDVFNSLGAAVWIILIFRLLLPLMVMKGFYPVCCWLSH